MLPICRVLWWILLGIRWGIIYVVVDSVANSGVVGEGLKYSQIHFVTRPR